METLGPKDVGGFYYTHRDGPPVMPKTQGIIDPPVACVRTKTLFDMGGWNTDLLHYGQDVEFNARILRLGGKISTCEDICVAHLDHKDALKSGNVIKYRESFNRKFDLIYNVGSGDRNIINSVYSPGGERYGILSSSQFPIFLVLPEKEEYINNVIKNINIFYNLFKNSTFVLPTKYSNLENMLKHVNIQFSNLVSKKDWVGYDLILNIGNNIKMLNYRGDVVGKYFESIFK
jgi:GT2 family glycosyltransferase